MTNHSIHQPFGVHLNFGIPKHFNIDNIGLFSGMLHGITSRQFVISPLIPGPKITTNSNGVILSSFPVLKWAFYHWCTSFGITNASLVSLSCGWETLSSNWLPIDDHWTGNLTPLVPHRSQSTTWVVSYPHSIMSRLLSATLPLEYTLFQVDKRLFFSQLFV